MNTGFGTSSKFASQPSSPSRAARSLSRSRRSRQQAPQPAPAAKSLQIARLTSARQAAEAGRPRQLDLSRHVARHGLQPRLVQCRASRPVPGRADGAERVPLLRRASQLRAGLDVPAVVLRQRPAAALDQPERLHAGGPHELRDPRDRSDARARTAGRSTCSARRIPRAIRCRRATPACAATSITARSRGRSRSSIRRCARSFRKRRWSARRRTTTSAEGYDSPCA